MLAQGGKHGTRAKEPFDEFPSLTLRAIGIRPRPSLRSWRATQDEHAGLQKLVGTGQSGRIDHRLANSRE